MGLTRKDFYATVVVAAGVLLALSVAQGWNWPLMNGVRMGILALGVTGIVACAVSGWATDKVSFSNPFMVIGGLLGVIALGAAVAGLFANTMPYLVATMAAVVLLWLVTVVHRLFAGSTTSRPITAS
jgi:hypothetical protein